ncbi:MAG: hypothetical protein HFE63_03545 [Clostridiales bacterium]|nr:hypothetical protein [Clostridiales bacterium]
MENITISIEEADKRALEEFCREVGLSLDSFFGIYIKKVLRDDEIPFEITSERRTSQYHDEPESSFLTSGESDIIAKAIDELKGLN